MKKSLLLSASILASASLYAAKYMHVNLDNGKEYDVKIEKTDRVSHIEKDSLKYIKIVKKDSSYSLYPLKHSKVNFDDEIARMDSNMADWKVKGQLIEGCHLYQIKYDTLPAYLWMPYILKNDSLLTAYNNCIANAKKGFNTTFSSKEEIYQANANVFANQMLATLADSTSKNYIFSPTSMQFALAMLANGTDDDSAYNDITKVLGCPDIELDSLNDWYQRRMLAMQALDPIKVKIGLANAVWLKKDVMFGKNFLQNLQSFYSASTNNVDFSQDSTYSKMDQWANEVTNGMIPSLGLADTEPNRLLVLANGLSFQSEWQSKFDASKTAASDFTTASGEVKQVDKMIADSIRCNYLETDQFQWTSRSLYEDYQMDFVLPKEGVTPRDILSSLDWENVKYKWSVDTVHYVSLKLPKFAVDDRNDLGAILRKMGFDDCLNANYGKIADDATINSANQLSHLEIDEDGVKGAAVTVVTMATDYLPRIQLFHNMDINRPFIVCVRNSNTHEVLFVGIINDPTLK